jgi:type IV pilus assembly protein PilB
MSNASLPSFPIARKLGELLLEAGLIAPAQLERALAESRQSGEPLGKILLKREWVTEEQLGLVLGAQAGTDYVRLAEENLEPEALALLPREFMLRHKAIPLTIRGGVLTVAMVQPNRVDVLDEIALLTGLKPRPLVTTSREFDDAFAGLGDGIAGEVSAAIASMRREAMDDLDAPKAEEAIAIEDQPAVRLLNTILTDAVTRGASDVHLEARERGLRVRFRLDGVMTDATEIPKDLEPLALARLKIMASLDIAERRRPQDGRARFVTNGKPYDLRVNFLPNLWGEKAVVRILRPAMLFGGLDNIGLYPAHMETLRGLIESPYGIVLVTGPTGSGKTTTLYSALYELNTPERNIITVEDPVEYPLEGISQTQTNPKVGMGFAPTLRSMLRQDPDVIMVGEIRDQETLDAAVFAALTGHLVLSTIHTNDAASTATRMMEMGLPGYLLTSAVRGVIGQRLVRRLCPHCREQVQPTPGLPAVLAEGPLWRATGCGRCRDTGFAGRIGLFEALPFTAPLQELINLGAPSYKLRAAAEAEGFASMADDGLAKIRDGLTTPTEVARALGPRWTEGLCRSTSTAR